MRMYSALLLCLFSVTFPLLSLSLQSDSFKYWHFFDAFINETDSDMVSQIQRMQVHLSFASS
jgi:hypothetical protein